MPSRKKRPFLPLKPTARHLRRSLLRTFSKAVSRTLLRALLRRHVVARPLGVRPKSGRPSCRGTLGKIEKGVPQAYLHARASSATLCSVQVLSVFLCIFGIKQESDTYQNGLGYISDTYPNPYPPVTVPPLMIILRPILRSEKGVFWKRGLSKHVHLI